MNFVNFPNLKGKYDVINIGSGPSEHDFNWSAIHEKKGYNFAVSPEDFRYDARILKNFGKYVKKDGIVLIVICPLSFAENAYLLEESFSYKYVKVLPAKDVDIPLWKYTLLKKSFLRLCIVSFNRFIHIPCYVIKHLFRKQVPSLNKEEELVNCWLKDNPYLINLKDIPEKNLSVVFEKKCDDLRKVVEVCYSNSLIPVFVLPPVSNTLQGYFSEEFLNYFLYENIKRVDEAIPLLDYMKDKCFSDDDFFTNGLFLKEEYTKQFTKDVLLKLETIIKTSRSDSKMKNEKSYKIGNDLNIPWIFYGTGIIWKYSRNKMLCLKVNCKQVLSSIKHFQLNKELYLNLNISKILKNAYDAGFRGFDTARIYGYSEKKIGKLYLHHKDIWVNTKCSIMDIERNVSPDTVEGNLDISKKNLKTKEINSILLHWPEGNNWLDVYRGIVREYEKGSAKVFGICNARIEDLICIQNAGLPLPMLIQNEIHPMNVQKDIRDFCRKNKIQLMAHTPTTRMRNEVTNNKVLKDFAEKYGKSIAQIIIRWHYQNDIIPVVSTLKKQHMKENLDIFDFELTNDEMNLIDEQDKNLYLITTRGIDNPNFVFNY